MPNHFSEKPLSRLMAMMTVLAVTLFVFPSLTGCGSGAVTSTTTSTSGGSTGGSSGGSSGDSTTPTDAVLTGTILIDSSADVLTVNSLKPHATIPASGYIILATDIATGSGTRSATTSSGEYALQLTTTSTYAFVLFDDNNRLQGVVTGTDFVDPSASGIVSQASSQKYVVGAATVRKSGSAGITTNGNGAAFWGKESLSATVTVAPLKPHVDYLVPVDKNGIPVARGGTDGNFGKDPDTTIATATTANAQDTDKDGLPDSVDADANGNGTADTLETAATVKPSLSNDRIASIKLHQFVEPASSGAGVDVTLTLDVTPQSSSAGKIDTVQLESGPSYIASMQLTLDDPAFPFNDPDAPSGRKITWSAVDYQLFRTTTGGTRWKGDLSPASQVMVGDAFTFKITYTDTARIDRFTYVVDATFSFYPQITKINGKSLADYAQAGTVDSPIPLTNRNITVEFARPKDEKGREITGLSYTAGLGYISVDTGSNTQQARGDDGSIEDSGVAGSALPAITIAIEEGDTIGGFTFRKNEIALEVTARIPGNDGHSFHSQSVKFSIQ